MGGIFGILGRVTDAETASMAKRLGHRGPETDIRRFDPDLVVGAIGRNPSRQIAEHNGNVIVCDATLYNDGDLRKRIGFSNSESAAALLLALLDSHGPQAIELLRGDFAFAHFDRKAGTISLGYDFMGCRPFFFSVLPNGGVAFASEYKAFPALQGIKPVPDLDVIQYLQGAKRVPPQRTCLQGVFSPEQGAVTTFDAQGRKTSVFKLPGPKVKVAFRPEEEAVLILRDELMATVERYSTDVDPIGLALSGGIDSIGLAFLFRKLHPERKIHTFTAGYGPDDPEMATAARVARAVGSEHHEVITPAELMRERLHELVWHLENPISRSESLQLLEIGRTAREFVSVLFSAQGADGLYGGMPKHKLLWLIKKFPLGRRGLMEFYALTQTGTKPKSMGGRVLEWLRYRGKLPPYPTVIGATENAKAVSLPEMSPQFINTVLARGFQTGTRCDKFERGFGAFGIEYRTPFFDQDLIRSAYTYADDLKVRRKTQKYILRRAFETIVPAEFLSIPKFPQRMKYDLEFARVLDEIRAEILSRESVEKRGLFVWDDLEKLGQRPLDKPYGDEAGMRIWTALLTEIWFQVFVDETPIQSTRSTG